MVENKKKSKKIIIISLFLIFTLVISLFFLNFYKYKLLGVGTSSPVCVDLNIPNHDEYGEKCD